jgi:hypothetical protein
MKKATTPHDLVVVAVEVVVAQRTTIHFSAVISRAIHKESLDQAHLNLLMQIPFSKTYSSFGV